MLFYFSINKVFYIIIYVRVVYGRLVFKFEFCREEIVNENMGSILEGGKIFLGFRV